MSEEEKQEEPKQEEKPQPKQEGPQQPQPAQLAQMNEAIAQLLKAQEENKKTIEMLAKAIVEVNKKVETKPSGTSGGDNPLAFLAELAKPQGGTLQDFARQAEAMARAGEALDRFRNPPRLGLGEAYLMRLGLRAAFPRYMTRAELKRAEKQLGVFETLEGEEGETEHVSE